MKKFLSFLLVLVLLTASLPVLATELSSETEEILIEGVTYKNIKRLEENGWQDIHVVTADLNQPHLQFDVLSHESGKSYLENTYASAVNHDAIVAVNADFFQATSESGRGNAIGLEIKDGKLRTSPAAYEQMNVLYQTKKDISLLFDMFTYSFTITAPDETQAQVSVINKYDSMTGIVMYTTDWGTLTPGSAGNVLEMVVEDGKVTAKNRDVGPVKIPENGYVLACDLSMHTFLDDCFQIGDKVILDIETTPGFEDIQTAAGGGGMLLENGKIPETYSHTVNGAHPRTAVGVDKTGKILTLVVVDGRRTDAAGMTMPQLSKLMLELGCYNAMNLDGGGSSLMAIKKDGTHQIANTLSGGYKRPVTNSIGILANLSSSRKLSSVTVKSDDDAVFVGTSTSLQLLAYDQYKLPMQNSDAKNIKWTVVSGKGSVQDGFFYPTAPGTAVIRGTYRGFSDEITLTVLDTPHRLTFVSGDQKLEKGDTCTLWLSAFDADGNAALVYPKDITVTTANPSVATIQNNTLKAVANGSTVISATFGETKAYMVATVGSGAAATAPKNVALSDPQQKSSEITSANGFTFTVFGNTRTPVKFFDLFIMNGVKKAVQSENDMNFFVGNSVDASLLEDLGDSLILSDGYASFKKNGSTFVTLKNAYGTTLFSSDKTQWEKLRAEVEKLSGGNFFVFLNDHNLSYSDTEIVFFKQLMKEAAKKADNVYVFAGGFVNETVIEDGVRYITTAGVFPSIGAKPPATNISYVKYYLVTVNGNSVTYETKGIVK